MCIEDEDTLKSLLEHTPTGVFLYLMINNDVNPPWYSPVALASENEDDPSELPKAAGGGYSPFFGLI